MFGVYPSQARFSGIGSLSTARERIDDSERVTHPGERPSANTEPIIPIRLLVVVFPPFCGAQLVVRVIGIPFSKEVKYCACRCAYRRSPPHKAPAPNIAVFVLKIASWNQGIRNAATA